MRRSSFPRSRTIQIDQIELIAPVSVRDALGINDGDPLILEVKSA